jgi:hypothetical protein
LTTFEKHKQLIKNFQYNKTHPKIDNDNSLALQILVAGLNLSFFRQFSNYEHSLLTLTNAFRGDAVSDYDHEKAIVFSYYYVYPLAVAGYVGRVLEAVP